MALPQLDVRPHRATLVSAALVVVTALLVVLAMRTLPEGAAAVASRDGALRLSGGRLQVTQVADEVLAHDAGMPAAMMPDPLPSGQRRIRLTLHLRADADRGLSYDSSRLRFGATGITAVGVHRDSLGAGSLPPGSQLDGEVVVQVPDGVGHFVLSVAGQPGSVAVDAPLPSAAAPDTHPSGVDHAADHDPQDHR